ncbi:AmmeMemoRadiSam system radical SAM enzyme [Desulforhopalus singaporensis]|uniref:Pyruvate formate lyase activating enzyme n=1 Tax=Desulforhopalus singaporensis TaxID=91360 RepID=A0A1H0TFG9_9BACT|nr:AmmeMemoRadiSam system radical SAM enzyme [Desulforhopalus singaporensis]SDP52734.1 pyruvate formate lyase activating enzyme [Desulforhopalus singaporensis]
MARLPGHRLVEGNSDVTKETVVITCPVCYQECELKDGQLGKCRVRQRKGDSIESLVYGKVVAEHVDPIEKKPIYHVLPGSLSYSIATPGCNFRCLHCQNSSISQVSVKQNLDLVTTDRLPQQIVAAAKAGGCDSISYTYVEPTVFLEFAYDCCVGARDEGLKNIFVSNGYMSRRTLVQLAPVLTAMNIDLKSFRDSFYQQVCGAKLQPVLENIRGCVELGVWLEVTTLIIPGLNDSDEELAQIAAFLSAINRRIPWHVTAFYPTYKMSDRKMTPPATLERARRIGHEQGLHHVYTGNIPGVKGANSVCHFCGEQVISRFGFHLTDNRLVNGNCPGCGNSFPGVWR